jgi:hypothetical protein
MPALSSATLRNTMIAATAPRLRGLTPMPKSASLRIITVAAATAAAILPLSAAGQALAAPAARSAHPAAAPGPTGRAITLDKGVILNNGYDAATDASGRTYIGWISNKIGGSAGRQVHLCTLLPGSRSCKGGVRTITFADGTIASSADALHVFTTPGGKVTLIWMHTTVASENGPQGDEIETATSQAGGPLSAPADQATGPSFGTMLDAAVAPNGQIWVLSQESVLTGMQVRPGLGNPFVNLKTPYGVGPARIRFNHGTPVIVIQKDGAVTAPVAYTSFRNGKFAHFQFVKHTWTGASDTGLVGTSSGIRLVTSVGNSSYLPDNWSWTGNGFGHPVVNGDSGNCAPGGHDLVTDASGRVADVTNECGFVVVENMSDTKHASLVKFPEHATDAGGDYQITTTPRGKGWAVWSIQTPASGDKLFATPILLPGTEVTASRTTRGNRVTVTGPASCLPPVDVKVGVKGKPARNWHVVASTLRLGSSVLHSTTLHGSGLRPGATFKLTGTVRFASGGSHVTVSAQLKFRSCKN